MNWHKPYFCYHKTHLQVVNFWLQMGAEMTLDWLMKLVLSLKYHLKNFWLILKDFLIDISKRIFQGSVILEMIMRSLYSNHYLSGANRGWNTEKWLIAGQEKNCWKFTQLILLKLLILLTLMILLILYWIYLFFD